MKFRFFVFLLILPLATVFPVQAQFEGEISFGVQQYGDAGIEESTFVLTAGKERMLLYSGSTVNVLGGVSANGLLIRNDHEDFVFHTGQNEALKITKNDLDGLINLLKRFRGGNQNGVQQFDWDSSVEETGNTKSLHGYQLQEFILKTDQPGNYSSIWLTDSIKMNWGLLSEFWYHAGKDLTESELPVELIMNKNSFPLVIEIYSGNQLVFQAVAKKIEKGLTEQSKFEISDNTKMLGFGELMMNMFRQQR